MADRKTESQRREKRRERIVTAAREAFSRKGYSDITVALITSEVGIAKGTFYLYFRSKEDLFLEVIRDAGIRLRCAVAEAVSGIDDPLEKVRESVPVIFDICRREAGLYLSIFQQASFLGSERSEEYGALYDPIIRDFQATIEDGVQRGIFKAGNSQMISYGVFGFMTGLIHQWLLLESRECVTEGYLEEMSETVKSFFCYGLTGEPFSGIYELNDNLRSVYQRQLDEVRRWQQELVRLEKMLISKPEV